MKYVRRVVSAIAVGSVLMTGLMAGSAYAQTAAACKKKCNDTYSACQKAGKDQNKCLAAWVECKKKCPKA